MTIAVDENLPVRGALSIATALRKELFEHMPALAVANVNFVSPKKM